MNQATVEDVVPVIEFDGEEWLYYRAIPIDVAIVRGTSADERGNVSMEHEGAYLGGLDQAMAARNNGGVVIAQVERLTTAESIPPQRVVRARRARHAYARWTPGPHHSRRRVEQTAPAR